MNSKEENYTYQYQVHFSSNCYQSFLCFCLHFKIFITDNGNSTFKPFFLDCWGKRRRRKSGAVRNLGDIQSSLSKKDLQETIGAQKTIAGKKRNSMGFQNNLEPYDLTE